MSVYPYNEIENKWRNIWSEKGAYTTALDSEKEKFYCLVMFSYPSAKKLHIGHWYNYAPTDTFARLKKMQGYNVLEPMGFDAFGLPAENYAVKQGVHPAITTADSIEYIRGQLKNIGAMYDWDKEVNTSSPDYYKWTQWLFQLLYKRGLAYQQQAPVNWCPSCQTVLANEQVIDDGECERCGTIVIKRDLKQWFFKITDYADRLLDDLQELNWPKKSITQQSNWIGRSEGAFICFPLVGRDDYIETFTTRADTLFGVTHIVLAPEHPMVAELTTDDNRAAVESYVESAKDATDIERQSLGREKTGVFTGSYVKNPLSSEKVAVWVADYVLFSYGTGAVMAVPAHDQRDFEFSAKYCIDIKVVIQNPDNTLVADDMTEAYTEYGQMTDSGKFSGLSSSEGKTAVAEELERTGQGGPAVTYHLHDWLISRQRFWGAPIPIIHCDSCGAVPVPEKDLPVLLPEGDIEFKPKGKSPLAAVEEFMNVDCSQCGKPARRDPDTMDTFVCSSWYYFRYPSNRLNDKPFDSDVVNKWLPIDQYVGGADHINGHLLYSRFITKVLHDSGMIDFDEPFINLRHQGTITNHGAKMSKSKENVVNPDEFTDNYGSDVFRLYLMFMGDYEVGGDWNDEGIVGVERFVDRIWRLYQEYWPLDPSDSVTTDAELERRLNIAVKSVAEDIQNFKFNTAIARLMELVNAIYGYIAVHESDHSKSLQLQKCLEKLPLILAPLTPHLSEELWSIVTADDNSSVFDQRWPEYDQDALQQKVKDIAVQINGKVRGTITIDAEADQDTVFETASNQDNIQKHLSGKNIIKKIYIKGKILNLVVK